MIASDTFSDSQACRNHVMLKWSMYRHSNGGRGLPVTDDNIRKWLHTLVPSHSPVPLPLFWSGKRMGRWPWSLKHCRRFAFTRQFKFLNELISFRHQLLSIAVGLRNYDFILLCNLPLLLVDSVRPSSANKINWIRTIKSNGIKKTILQ